MFSLPRVPIRHEFQVALDRPVSGHSQDASTTNQELKRHHLPPPPLRPSAEFPAAYATSYSCLQEVPKPLSLWACRTSTSHMPFGADIDRKNRRCSSRDPDRRISRLPWRPRLFEPFPDR